MQWEMREIINGEDSAGNPVKFNGCFPIFENVQEMVNTLGEAQILRIMNGNPGELIARAAHRAHHKEHGKALEEQAVLDHLKTFGTRGSRSSLPEGLEATDIQKFRDLLGRLAARMEFDRVKSLSEAFKSDPAGTINGLYDSGLLKRRQPKTTK